MDLLVAVACTVLVVAAQVPVVRGCCAEEDGRGQVVAPSFAELIHFPWDTRLDGHTVTCQGESKWSGSGTRWHAGRSSTKNHRNTGTIQAEGT